MSDTPITDKNTWATIAGAFKCSGANGDLEGAGEYVPTSLARQLERDLNAARDALGELVKSGTTSREAELERELADCVSLNKILRGEVNRLRLEIRR